MARIQAMGIASKSVREDFISNMPDNVVTNILDRLALQDAVRTGILSRNWRFKWNMLSQIVCDKNFYMYLVKTNGTNKYEKIVSRLLPNLRGAITKFVFYITEKSKLHDEDINHWILLLSRRGIKDLTLEKSKGTPLKLHTHLFSCLELKHLKLSNCCFNPPTGFRGFTKLLSLELTMVQFKDRRLGKFITRCPSLEILNIRLWRPSHEILIMKDKVKLVEIAKLENLKVLSLSLCQLDSTKITNSSSVFELVGFLPKLQELHLDFVKCKFTEGGAKKRSHSVFPCLTNLKLTRIHLGNDIMLSCVVELIRCFPNLQTLEITTFDCNVDRQPAIPKVDYNTMWPLQLRSVVFRDLKGSKNEVCLIKNLLVRSPFLEKIAIHLHTSTVSSENVFARKLLKLHRASPVAEIKLY